MEISDTLDSFLVEEKLHSLSLIVPCWTMVKLTRDQERTLHGPVARRREVRFRRGGLSAQNPDPRGPAGGFILGPSHSIAMNTKYENFMVMLDEFVSLRDRF